MAYYIFLIENKVAWKMCWKSTVCTHVSSSPRVASGEIKVIPCKSKKICSKFILHSSGLCSTSGMQSAFDLLSFKCKKKKKSFMTIKCVSHSDWSLFTRAAVCLDVNENYSRDVEVFRSMEKRGVGGKKTQTYPFPHVLRHNQGHSQKAFPFIINLYEDSAAQGSTFI